MPVLFAPTRSARIASRTAICAGALLAVAACSPAYNWREVRFDDADLAALLPCKPDRAQQPMPTGAETTATLDMMGCRAGGATFTLSHVHLDPPADAAAASETLERWQAATRARLSATPSASAAFTPQGAAVAPGSVKLLIETKDTDGKPLFVQMALFMRQSSAGQGGFDLFQAAIYRGKPGGKSGAEAADNFFSSLRLP